MPLYRGEYDDAVRPFTEACAYKLSNSKRFHGQRKWEHDTPAALLNALKVEIAELEEAMKDGTPIEVILESADVANLAMMIADRYGLRHLKAPTDV